MKYFKQLKLLSEVKKMTKMKLVCVFLMIGIFAGCPGRNQWGNNQWGNPNNRNNMNMNMNMNQNFGRAGNNFPMASPQDPPPGVQSQPVNLGNYKTCDGYATFLSQRIGGGINQMRQQNPMQRQIPGQQAQGFSNLNTVRCRNSHTCQCLNNQYFIDNLPNQMGGVNQNPNMRQFPQQQALGGVNEQQPLGGMVQQNTLYRCIEPPNANAEDPNVYQPSQLFPGRGVIKFALPRSFCNRNQQGFNNNRQFNNQQLNNRQFNNQQPVRQPVRRI